MMITAMDMVKNTGMMKAIARAKVTDTNIK